ncbi:hypothetical protein CIT37_11090 [Bradyrhizobium ottawaense]|uniref:Uncharacterized protein n=1 Tax=Bradyrhizobium ottawaense TaxID=931866 RepID=A0A2U8P4N2_9BRAD|nr:hypothetical protein [Bradyrhizobium ottawaense]AWL92695.1 hypothetical protein CIT37_11090 [Bradyrhizobium ottawaense]
MADSALENAERRRDALAGEINALQQEIETKRKELERVKQFISDYMAFSSPTGELQFTLKPPPAPVAKKGKQTANPDRKIVGDHVERLLRKLGHPIPRDDLFMALKLDGVEIVGKDALMVLSTMMWRMQERFVRIPGKGYWLKWEPCPAVGYIPPPAPLMPPDYK